MSVNTIIQHQSLTAPCFVAASRADKSAGNHQSFNDSDLAQQPFNQWLPSSAIRRRSIEWVKFSLATVLLTLLVTPSMAQMQSEIPACGNTDGDYDIDFNDNGLIDI